MRKDFSWVFLLASGAFFVFVVGLTGYRIGEIRKHNTAAVRVQAESLAAKVHSLRDITGSLQSPLFKTDMRDVFEGEPRLLLLSVHSPQDGIVYLMAKNRAALKEPGQITPEWRGTIEYQVNRGSELLVRLSLGSDMPGMTMDTVFGIMGRDDLYPVVRDDLYAFLAFLLVCGVALLIVMSVQEDAESFLSPGITASTPAQAAEQASRAEPRAIAHPDARRALTSPRTGLVWKEYLEPRTKAELERAAASDQDISLARIRIDEPFTDGRLPAAYVEIAKLLKQTFSFHDLIFETGDDSYTLLVPDADVDSAVRVLEDLRMKLSSQPVEGRVRTLSIGVSSRGGRLIDDRLLRVEADVALAKASREGGNRVIGFRADAARFRETLSGGPT